MSRPTTTNAYTATTAITGCRIVKYGAADGAAVLATAATEFFVGISDKQGADAGELCDVHETGEADVTYGGNVTRGQPLTSDNLGRAVYANPAAGVNNEIIGYARFSGVAGDIHPITITRSRIQGAA